MGISKKELHNLEVACQQGGNSVLQELDTIKSLIKLARQFHNKKQDISIIHGTKQIALMQLDNWE